MKNYTVKFWAGSNTEKTVDIEVQAENRAAAIKAAKEIVKREQGGGLYGVKSAK